MLQVESMAPKSRTASVLPVEEPYATPMRPSRIVSSSSKPACASAISVAQVASSDTRPMERVTLRVKCAGAEKLRTGPPRRVLSSGYRAHSGMRSMPLVLARRLAEISDQLLPIEVMPAMPVTATRPRHQHIPPLTPITWRVT